ncbi:MAG: hypothetical protein H7287_00325 [Thermoleophilia bacterium]|nr:hypothetical protein [Thermoleophilia bacterium]
MTERVAAPLPDAERIRTETLANGVRIVIAERPGASATKMQVGRVCPHFG